MGEEVRLTNYNNNNNRVTEWELGLPTAVDLMPLSQSLVPTELATAFSITPESYRTMTDVTRASQDTLSNLRTQSVKQPLNKLNGLFNGFKSVEEEKLGDEIFDIETEENVETVDGTVDGSDLRKLRRVDSGGDDSSARTSKPPRLVWTPQLHKRFVEVVAHLGVKNAVPKTIMQLMNVEGLTRENVASHLQKYRLYLKRMQGLNSGNGFGSGGDPVTDHLFASSPVPPHFLQQNSDSFLQYMPVAALQQQQHQQMAGHHLQRHFGSTHLSRQLNQHVHVVGTPVRNSYVDDLDYAAGKKALTLFPTVDD